MRRIAVINQCDGVGKTTVAACLGHALAMSGQRVTLIDLDPRGALAAGFGIFRAPSKGIDRVMLNGTDLSSVRIGARDLVSLIPAGITLTEVEQRAGEGSRRVRRLRETIEGRFEDQAYVLFDCPSSNGLLTMNAIFAADELLIPVTSEMDALNGAVKALLTLKRLAPFLPNPVTARILLNRYSPRHKASREMRQRLLTHFPEALLETAIHEGQAIAESSGVGRTIFEYRAGSHSAGEFRALADELSGLPDRQLHRG